jgi:LPXTG-motif cell wall-anchored protein
VIEAVRDQWLIVAGIVLLAVAVVAWWRRGR